MNRALLFLIVLATLFDVSLGESWMQNLRRRVGFGASSNNPVSEDGTNGGYGEDCVVGEWVSWGSCSATCGTGSQQRTRRIVHPASNGGAPCPETSDSLECNTQSCSTDCVVGEWQNWGSCSATCGGGQQTRTRMILTQPSYGGAACPATTDTTDCNTDSCAVDCVVGEWQNWGSCSKECGGGKQARTRVILTQAQYGGAPCPATSDEQDCNTQPCAVDCVVGEWQSWGSCSATCGGGHSTRTRAVLTQPAYGGAECPPTSEDNACNTQPCAVDCVVGEWASWGSECSASCGGGTTTRTRAILTPASNGGAECPPTSEDNACNTQPCAVDCVVGEWTAFGYCSVTCGGGQQTRTREILTQAAYGGSECPATSESQPCNTQYCSVDCVMGEWQSWGPCSKTCGGGTSYRTRTSLTPSSNGGAACGETESNVPCNTQTCGY